MRIVKAVFAETKVETKFDYYEENGRLGKRRRESKNSPVCDP